MQDRYDNEEFSLLQLFYSRLKYYKYIYIYKYCMCFISFYIFCKFFVYF